MSTVGIDESKPGVIIVGAGIAGLMLAILLEQLGHPYHIFERATKIRPLGSVMTLGANVLPVFEQLGLLEDIKQISHPCYALNIYGGDNDMIGAVKVVGREGTGYDDLVFERPRFHELLFKQIPSSKVSLGKKVLRTEEKEGRVFIHCSDNTTYEGDILVGADGAYSGIRQSMYKQLDQKGLLPTSDQEELSIASVMMVGVAAPTDLDRYPQFKDDFAHFTSIRGNDLTGITVVSVPGNRICWSAGKQLSADEGRQQLFRNSEWGPESNESMMKEYEGWMTPWGVSTGDIMSAAPKDLISKIYLEEKMFETWYHGRTVLIGDACHKMLTGAGQGAINAMQDAVVLANCIYNMPDSKPASITAAFQEFHRQRYSRALEAFKLTRTWMNIYYGMTWGERLIRQILFNYIPSWVQRRVLMRNVGYRPQIAWLPLVENRGYAPVLPQEGRRKIEEEDAQPRVV
ncbi:hypothetical protein EDD11_009019 [Mortierella claussenii]|nr:hypothetical protein EDD11_009019 [Mortierella claussenii]